MGLATYLHESAIEYYKSEGVWLQNCIMYAMSRIN